VAVLLNEGADVIGVASQAGFRCFTSVAEFQRYICGEVLGEGDTESVSSTNTNF